MTNKLMEIAEDSVKGGLFLFTGNALSLIISAIGSIIVARLLGPESYGLLALSLIVPSLISGLIDFGVNNALTMYLAKLRAEGRGGLAVSVLKSGLLFKLMMGIATSIICFALSDMLATYILNRPGIGFLVKIASLLILLQALFTALNSSFVGLDRMDRSALMMNMLAVVKSASAPSLVALGLGVVGALTGYILGYAIAALAGLLALLNCCRVLGAPSEDSFMGNIKAMVRYGLPLYLSALLSLFLGQYQTIILAFSTSDFDIGNFRVAVSLSSLVGVLSYPLMALFPAFSKLERGSGEFKKFFRHSVKYSALLVIPATMAIAILSEDIVRVLYGENYSLAPLFLSLYVLTFLYAGAGSLVLGHLFSGVGETMAVLKCNLINLLAFLPLAPLLTIVHGVPGLILALLTSNLLSLIYGLAIASKKLGVNVDFKSSSRIYLASFISAVPLLTFLRASPLNSPLNLVIGGPLFLLAYLTIVPLTGAINYADIENLRLIFSKLRAVWPIVKPVLAYEAKLLSTMK